MSLRVVVSKPSDEVAKVKKECPVCCEEAILVTCFCGFEVCPDCCKRWISDNAGLARCMGCKKEWTDGFIVKHLGHSYYVSNADNEKYKGYRLKYKTFLHHLHESRIQKVALDLGDVAVIKRSYEKQQALAEKLSAIKDEITRVKLARENYRLNRKTEKKSVSRIKMKEYAERVNELRGEILEIESSDDMRAYARAKTRILRGDLSSGNKDSAPPPKVLCPCPYDGCRALVVCIEKKWRCLMDAGHLVCKKCLSPAPSAPSGSTNHRCDPNDLATVKSFEKNTKPCPNCGVRIYRIEGCTIMWCTACNNGFDWNNLTHIDNKWVHNPHFTEWKSKGGGGVIAQDGCDEAVYLRDFPPVSAPTAQKMLTVWVEFAESAAARGAVRPPRDIDTKYDVHTLALLVGEYDQAKWVRRIFLDERRDARDRLRRTVCETAGIVVRAELRQFKDKLHELNKRQDLTQVARATLERQYFRSVNYRLFEFLRHINATYAEEAKTLGFTKTTLILDVWKFPDEVRECKKEEYERKLRKFLSWVSK